MEISLILAEEIAKLFIIMAMGWALVKTRILKTEDSRVISAVTVYMITPCVIIGAFQIEPSPQVTRGLVFSLAAAAASHALFLLLAAAAGKILKLDAAEKLTIVYTNAGILVIPLVHALLGERYVIYSCAFIIIQVVLLWTHCLGVLKGRAKAGLKNILLNVNVVSIAVGGAMFLFGLRRPRVIGDTVKTAGAMVGPLGMTLAGMVIADIPARRVFLAWRNYLAAALRLAAAPLMLLAAFRLCGAADMIQDGKNILLVVYLAGITPACAAVTSMAQLYGGIADRTGILYVLTTLLSIVTMPIAIGLYAAFI